MANMAEEKVKCHEIDRVQGLQAYFILDWSFRFTTIPFIPWNDTDYIANTI